MDLEYNEGPEVIQALVQVTSDESEDSGLVESAAESLGGILARTNTSHDEILKSLTPQARGIVIDILKARGCS
ncbi:hypothetical protein ACFC0K_36180 [Streptomyces hydrogenans]|uniref:hypothetical protein n=1 Tax=Streptomyces hydrogenans TaxID=1873719 RepID=UPI0035DA6EA9